MRGLLSSPFYKTNTLQLGVNHVNNIMTKFSLIPDYYNVTTGNKKETHHTAQLPPYLNFHPLEVVSRWRDPQLQVSENYSDLTKWRSTLFMFVQATINVTFLRVYRASYHPTAAPFPSGTIRWSNIGLMLGQCRRRWANIKPTLV